MFRSRNCKILYCGTIYIWLKYIKRYLMTTLIMPSDYGMEMLVGSSPVLGSGFLGSSSYFSDYSRCAPLWSHAAPVSCLTNSVTTTTAKTASSATYGFKVTSGIPDGSSNGGSLPTQPLSRVESGMGSVRNSIRRRKIATVDVPLQLQQNLKPCLISRNEEQVPEGAVSPTKEKKRVSFADMTGGNLTHIKIITERPDCPPRWSSDFLEQLTGGAKAEAVPDEWALTFSQPASDYMAWKNKLERDSISLENVVIKEAESLLIGTVKVRNIAFKKSVIVRYTTTNWVCQDDVEATYVPVPSSGSSYNIYDTFIFQIPLPSSSQADKLEFCLCYYTDGLSFWDSNNNKNYAVVAFKSKKGDSAKKPEDLYDVHMDAWSEFSAWNNLESKDSPYW